MPSSADDEADVCPTAAALDDAAPTSVLLPDAARQPVPVTLITGYLGAGKTTLVKHILHGDHGLRIAVILNEYGGEPGIEAAFVQDAQGAREAVPQWVELANGCLCCSVKAEFVQALEALLDADGAHAERFDYVLVETTGLANPGPIIGELWTDEELEAAVTLDAVITLVDARNIGRQLAEARPGGAANEAQLQVALADVILLNKMDLVDSTQAAAITAQLRAINSSADVVCTTHSVVDLPRRLNRGAYRLRLLEQQQQQQQEQEQPAPLTHPLAWLGDAAGAAADAGCAAACQEPGYSHPGHGHSHSHHPQQPQQSAPAACSAHDQAVRTVSLRLQQPLRLGKFRDWLEQLLWAQLAGSTAGAAAAAAVGVPPPSCGEPPQQQQQQQQQPPPELLRVKGLLDVAGSEHVHLLQAVCDLYDIAEGASWQHLLEQQQHEAGPAPPGRMSRLVFIGRHLDAASLQAQLQECCLQA